MPIIVGKCPVPFPHITNQNFCCAQQQVCPDILRMRCDPYVRLFSVPTKSFAMKKCGDPCAAKDSLDLALSACYDHHRQWHAPRAATKIQCPTYAVFPWGRCQQRLCKLQCLPDVCCESCIDSTQNQSVVNHEPYRDHSSHMQCSVSGPHISNSARGYGRGSDGLFYNC